MLFFVEFLMVEREKFCKIRKEFGVAVELHFI